MGCCGDRRAISTARFGRTPTTGSTSWTSGAPPAVPVRYIGAGAVAVVGTVTARTYQYRSPGAVEHVDARDVPGLLRTGRFRRA
jgi:hypothetical protein